MARAVEPLLATNSTIKNRSQLINARLCVLARLDRDLPEEVGIQSGGWDIDQKLVYELDCFRYSKCRCLGHLPLKCPGETNIVGTKKKGGSSKANENTGGEANTTVALGTRVELLQGRK